MRIVFTSHYALPHLGGIEVVVDQLARALTNRGHEVTHIAAAAVRRGEQFERPPYDLVRLPASNVLEERFGIPYPLLAPGFRMRFDDALRAADVIHAHGMLYALSASALKRAARCGVPRVLTEHAGFSPYPSGWKNSLQKLAISTVGRASAKRAQVILTLNPTVGDLMRRLAPAARHLTIANGVDCDFFRPASPAERSQLRTRLGWDALPRVLFVGRMLEKKGADLALAVAEAGRGAFRVVMAGPGELIERSAYADFIGAQPREKIAELYRAADAFLLPSSAEGFPLTAQEAMASGLAVVLTRDRANETVLAGAGAGAHLAARDVKAMLDGIHDVLAAGHAAREAAVRFARDRFSTERFVDQHISIYSGLAGDADE